MDEALVLQIITIALLSIGLYGLNYLRREILDLIDDLDSNLAAALQGTIAQVAENIEPPNPLHGLIMKWIESNANPGVPDVVDVLARDETGRFQPKD